MSIIEDEEQKLLLSRMSTRTPILLLGAGFSNGARDKKQHLLPMAHDLAKELFENVICKAKGISPENLEEYKEHQDNLKNICYYIEVEDLTAERDKYLKERMSGCNCPSDDYHMLLRDYPWRHIYTLNIDNLVEFIYSQPPKREQPLVHVKQKSTLDSTVSFNLYKLHGSVERPDLGYVFSEQEYSDFLAQPSWSLSCFGTDFLTNDVIFLGTEFQESDLYGIIHQKLQMIEIDKPYHYFFVSPKIDNLKLKKWIENNANVHFIPWNTKQFLSFVKKNIVSVGESRRKMRDYGMQFYDDIKQECASALPGYVSELYLGAPPRPMDFFKNLDFVRPNVVEAVKEIGSSGGNNLILVTGDSYVGKTCAAIRLGVGLMGKGYEFGIFSLSDSMDAGTYCRLVLEYLGNLPSGSKVAILSENMPYYYSFVKQIIEKCPNKISSLIYICTGITRDHGSKKYLLDQCKNQMEIHISEKTQDGRFARIIYEKLEETSHLNKLHSYADGPEETVAYIKKINDIIDVLFIAHEGRHFVAHFSDWIKEKEDMPAKSAFLLLSSLFALDVVHLSSSLFLDIVSRCDIHVKMETFIDEYKDVVQIRNGYIQLRCSRLLWASIKEQLNGKVMLSWIKSTVVFLASNLQEREESIRNEIFQKLLKVKNLHKCLYLKKEDILTMLVEIEAACKHLSYYWVQRGITNRELEHFEEANNAFSEAASIRNNSSFHVRHAQAKNYMAWGVWAVDHEPNRAIYYFDIGKEQIEKLLRDAPHRYFAYSAHTYVDMTLRFYEKMNKLIDKESLIEFAEILTNLLNGQDDQASPGITWKFLNYCKKIQYSNKRIQELDSLYKEKYGYSSPDLSRGEFDTDDVMDTSDLP